MNPSHFAIRNPAPIFILVLLIVFLGVAAYRDMPKEAAPDIQVPLLIVTLPYPGASPEDVETLVTDKAEVEFQNVDDLKKLTSASVEGASAITLEFRLGTDISEARSRVREKLDEILPELPADVEDPIITEINLSEQPMLIVNMAGEIGEEPLKELAEDLKDDIEAIPGILEVRRVGGRDREVNVAVDPDKLRAYRLSLDQVSASVDLANTNIPGGSLEIGPTKYLIRVPSEYKTAEEIRHVVIAAPGRSPIFVKDVATVSMDFTEESSRARLDGVDSVSLVVVKRSGENLLGIREQIRALVESYNIAQEGRVRLVILADQGTFVERILRDLQNNIATGFLMVLAVLLIMMGLRNALFVATAIPLSFLLTLVTMQLLGYTLNFVVLFSLILALGMLVDNAIVVVENIFRHIQGGKTRLQGALDGIGEVALPVTTSTITTLVAFAPILFMPGIAGEFMSYLPETLIIALTASLFVALIVNPVLVATLMPTQLKRATSADELETVRRSRFMRGYMRVLSAAIRRRWWVLAGAVLAFAVVFVLYAATTLQRRGVEFFPGSEPDTATILVEAPSGTTLAVSDRYVRQVEAAVEPYRDSIKTLAANVGQRQGFGAADSGGTSSHLSYLTVEFPDWRDWNLRPSEVVRRIRDDTRNISGAEIKVVTQGTGPETGAPVNIEVRGEDFAPMLEVTEAIKERLAGIPGLVNLSDNFDRSRPELRVLIDREKAARVGLNTRDIAFTVRTAFNGREVSELRQGKDEYDIVVRLDERFRLGADSLERLYLPTPDGNQVPISSLGTITTGPAYGSINHVGQDRVITVSGDAAEGVAGPVLLQQAQARIADLVLPPGVTLSFTGENEDLEEMQSFLGRAFLIALFLIFLVLVAQFNSVMTPFIIMSAVVLSLMGVFIGLMIHDRPFSVMMGGIGTISLAGIVVNNSIVLVDFIQQLRKRGHELIEAVVLAGAVRLRPVLLTAVTTVLGLAPVAMGMEVNPLGWPVVEFGSQGSTFWVPMAQAVIYGLSVATVLTLIVVPVLYTVTELSKARLARLFRRGKGGDPSPETPGAAAAPTPDGAGQAAARDSGSAAAAPRTVESPASAAVRAATPAPPRPRPGSPAAPRRPNPKPEAGK